MRTDYEVKCYTGATRMQSELDAAFNLVAPRDNWKNSIDTIAKRGHEAKRDTGGMDVVG